MALARWMLTTAPRPITAYPISNHAQVPDAVGVTAQRSAIRSTSVRPQPSASVRSSGASAVKPVPSSETATRTMSVPRRSATRTRASRPAREWRTALVTSSVTRRRTSSRTELGNVPLSASSSRLAPGPAIGPASQLEDQGFRRIGSSRARSELPGRCPIIYALCNPPGRGAFCSPPAGVSRTAVLSAQRARKARYGRRQAAAERRQRGRAIQAPARNRRRARRLRRDRRSPRSPPDACTSRATAFVPLAVVERLLREDSSKTIESCGYRETEHLRVLIANERRDRLALVVPIVASLGHEVIAREVEVDEVGAVTAGSARTSRSWGSARARSTRSS